VIAGTNAKQHLADTVPLRCVGAISLTSRATDAQMRLAQESWPTLRGDSRERGATVVATARRRLRPHRAVAKGRLRSANPLIQKAATASDRTDRKNRGSFYFVGSGWSSECGIAITVSRLPCSCARNCLLIFCFPCSNSLLAQPGRDRSSRPTPRNDWPFCVSIASRCSWVQIFSADRRAQRAGALGCTAPSRAIDCTRPSGSACRGEAAQCCLVDFVMPRGASVSGISNRRGRRDQRNRGASLRGARRRRHGPGRRR